MKLLNAIATSPQSMIVAHINIINGIPEISFIMFVLLNPTNTSTDND